MCHEPGELRISDAQADENCRPRDGGFDRWRFVVDFFGKVG
jgi:hypothetical protein